MQPIEILILSIGLAMDAFAVSICKGLALQKPKSSTMMMIGLWFGGFQAGMPLLGYLLGSVFTKYIEAYDHWIAFILLGYIGGNMIKEAFEKDTELSPDVSVKAMFILAIATSIDAMTVGVTFAFLRVNLWLALTSIGIITFGLSCLGVGIGSHVGEKYGKRAELVGGIVLIVLGTRILLSHLGIV